MRKIVFDIETCAYPFESLSESQQEYILRYPGKEKDEALRSEKSEEAIRFLSLYPFCSKIISTGIYDVSTGKTFVYFESGNMEEWTNEEKNISYKGLTEEEMIKSFWRIIQVTDHIITFNGRCFDAPFLMMRSAMLRIKPSRNLITNRYDQSFHTDLLEQLTYYGLTKKFNLDFYCQAFGIKTPKSAGISGMEVKNLYEAGRIKDIAVYCGKDVAATFELYKIWDEYLNI